MFGPDKHTNPNHLSTRESGLDMQGVFEGGLGLPVRR